MREVRLVIHFLCILLFVTPNVFSQIPSSDENSILIATFSIRIFSTGSRDDEELYQICDELKHFDFIAIQEVRDTEILDRTIRMLKDRFQLDYRYVSIAKVGRGVKEIYAYLYRTDKVEYLDERGIFSDPEDRFIREPSYALFRAGNFDFYIINIHLIYGKTVSERRTEAERLKGIYILLQDSNDENDVLLMGDFNLSPQDEGFEPLRELPGMVFVNKDLPTSIKDRLYDNIWFQSQYTQEYTDQFVVMKFDETDFGNDDRAASLAVSDHRPLWAIFDIRNDDD